MYGSKYLILLLVTILPISMFAQTDITGLWKGTLYNDSTKKYYRYEIGISEEKSKLSGFSHTFFLVEDREYYGVKKVKVKKAGDKIIIEDAGLIANNYPEAPAKGVRQLNVLTLEIKDSVMSLSGPFTTNRTKEYSVLTGTVNLQRRNDFWQSALVPHLQELGLSDDLSFVKQEKEIVQQEEAKKKKEEAVAARLTKESKKEIPVSKVAENKNKEPIAMAPVTNVSETTVTKQEKPVVENATAITKTIIDPGMKEPVKKENTNTDVPVKSLSAEDKKKEAAPAENKHSNAATAVAVQQQEQKEINEPSIKTGLPEPVRKKQEPASDVAARTTVLQQTVLFSSDSLQLSLYDNGEVDGDTVSVLMNGKIIMAKVGLSTKAVQRTIYVEQGMDQVELLMYAENLGAIAPNTGLLVVHDGKSNYEIRFSGDLKKNASIILQRRKNQ